MKKRIISIVLSLVMVVGLLPTGALAASDPNANRFDISEGNITIKNGATNGTVKVTYGSAQSKDNINPATMLTITGKTDSNMVIVDTTNDRTVQIALDSVDIQLANASAFDIQGASVVEMTLVGTNMLNSGLRYAGLQVENGYLGIAAVTIGGNGSLEATGGEDAAGIGSRACNSNSGKVTIISGTVKATGMRNGGGIGGGGDYMVGNSGGAGGEVTITGGTVIAKGGDWRGAGIGGGGSSNGGAGGSIKITGGNVTAIGGGNAAGIGGGSNDTGYAVGAAGNIKISNTAKVIAVSWGTKPPIDDNDGSITPDSGTVANVLVANYQATVTGNANTEVKDASGNALSPVVSFAPQGEYKSIAFTMPMASYTLYTGAAKQMGTKSGTTSTTFTVAAGLNVFADVTASTYTAKVTVNKDGNTWTGDTPTIKMSTSSSTLTGAVSGTLSNGEYTFNGLADGKTYYAWEDGATDTCTGQSVTIASNFATVNYYTLSLGKGTGIASASDGGIYLKGKSADISATLDVGYEWDKWSDTVTTQNRTITVNAQTSLTANAKLMEATVPNLSGTNPSAVTFGYTTAPSMTVGISNADNTNFNYTYAWYAGNTVSGTVLISLASYTAPAGLAAGAHNYTVRVTATNKASGSKTAYADKTFTVTANKASGGGSVAMAGWTYGGTASEPVPTSTTNGTASVTYQYKGINATNYAETATKPTNAGDYTVTATFASTANYNQFTATANFTIAKAKVTLPVAVTGLVYNGSEQIGVASADPALYTVSLGKATNAGAHTATVTLVDQTNYEWNISTPSSTNQTIEWSIAKAPITFAVTNNNLDYNAGPRSATVTQTASEVLKIPANGYAVSYAQDSVEVADPTNKGSYEVVVTISDPNFKHASTADAGMNAGALKINETTYPQAASMTWPTAANLTYGQKLSDSTLSGGDQTAKGTYTWKDGTSIPTVVNSGYTVVFTTNDANYTPVEHTVSITVSKATPTLSLPTAANITYGQKLSVSALTGGSAGTTYNGVSGTDVSGTFTWTTPDTMPSVSDSGATDYALTFTPTDSGSYNVVTTGKIKLTVDQKEVGLTWSGYESLVYSGSPVSVTATATGLVGVDACTLTVTEGNDTNAGNHKATATTLSNPNYKLPAAKTLNYTIAKAPITFVVSGNSYTYDASNKTATVVQNATDALQMPANSFDVIYQQSGGNITPKDAGTYDVMVTINDDNFKFEGQAETTRTFKVGTLTIGKKSITALWKNLHHVYDGTTKSVTFAFTGVETDDKNQVNAQLSAESSKTNSGSYSIKAELTGTRSSNYTLTNPAGSLVIQKAPVTFTVSDDMVKHDGSAKTATVTAAANGAAFTEFTVTYRKDGKAVEKPTDIGGYDIYSEFTNTNYRHVDGTDGTARKIGVLNIYKETAPATYTLSFAPGEGGSGSMTLLLAAQAGSARALPVCTFTNTKSDAVFVGWQYNSKIYQPEEVLEQPSSNISITAIWLKSTFTISGVVNQDGTPAADVVVTLMLGSRQIAETVTDGSGKYSFDNVAPSLYNLVVSKNGVTQTTTVDIVSANVTGKNITLPVGKTNSVVQVTSGSPDIVVGNLEKTFAETENPVYTSADKAVVTNGGSVEIKLTANLLSDNKTDEDQSEIAKKASGTVALFLELKLEKTVTSNTGITTTTNVPVSNVLLETVILLPGELQGKSDYTICRLHDGKLDTITTNPNPNGEYIKVNSEKTTLTVYCKNFSTYAIAYTTYFGGGEISYPINIDSAGIVGGVIKADKETATLGTKVTITVKPNEGCKLTGLTITDKDGKAISYQDNKDGTYTFSMPDGKISINAAFETTDSAFPFVDVPKSDWARKSIEWVYGKHLFAGTSKTTFEPNAAITRGMIAAVLFRMEGSPAGFEKAAFSDVAADSYYANAIGWGFKNGLVKGFDKSLYGPEDNITREQLASILYRYAEFKNYDLNKTTTLERFADGKDTSDYAKKAISWAVENGLLAGKGDGVLDPTGAATRAEAAAILMRFDAMFGEKA